MNKVFRGPGAPRRTSTREANDRSAPFHRQESVNVMTILADKYPEKAEDYALHLYYLANKHNPFFQCTSQRLDANMEDVHVTINGSDYQINIRSGVINKK
jgi:hypothetical protein